MNPSGSEILIARGLRQAYGSVPVLDGLSFGARAGEFISIIGPSGCGKTVLLRLLAGLERPAAGEIRLGSEGGPEPRVAFAFQKAPLFPWLRVGENIEICMNGDGQSREERRRRMREALAGAGLADAEQAWPRHLSGGMRQKVSVLRAFCSGWPLIFLDEPFVSLDFPSRRELQLLTLDLWARERKTILFVTHDVDEALLLSDRLLVLSPRPARVLADLPVSLPRPRDPAAVRGTPEYGRLFAEVSRLLTGGGA